MRLLNTLKWPLTLIVVTVLVIVGVILIGGNALGIPEATQATVLHWAGGIGTLAAAPLAFLIAYLTRDEDHNGVPDFLERRRERRSDPPTRPTALLLGACVLIGCGAGFLDAAAPVARAAQDVQIVSEPVIRQLRREAIEQAIREVYDAGGTRSEAVLARTRVERVWRCPIDGHRTYASAVSTFIEALWLAKEAGQEPAGGDGDGEIELLDFMPLARRIVDAYRAIASCANTLEPGQLPVPTFLDIFPPSWEAPSHG